MPFAKKGIGGRSAAVVLVLVVAALQVGCLASAALDASKSEAAGTVQLTSASLGNRTLAPTACASGEHQVFLGADFVDGPQGITTRLIIDPAGVATLRLFATSQPLDQGLLFRREDCSQFQLSLERTGWRINDVYDLRVSLEVDCRSASGDSIQGALTVGHCH
jgi:hypothetical protein